MAEQFVNNTFSGANLSVGAATTVPFTTTTTYAGSVVAGAGQTFTINGNITTPGSTVNITQTVAGVQTLGLTGEYLGFSNNGSGRPTYYFQVVTPSGLPGPAIAVSTAAVNAVDAVPPATINTSNVTSPNDPTLPCFTTGTRILTERGEVAVEDLEEGECVITGSGEARPIRWIGKRTIDCRRHQSPELVQPIQIAANAFSEGRPSRDLCVSPGHSIAVDILGEVLMPAGVLVNGTTIQQLDVDAVTYWHVELDSHDILLAENLPAESYLDMSNRSFFGTSNVIELNALPDADVLTHDDFCRPFHESGPLVTVVRARLRERAVELGWRVVTSSMVGMHLLVDGERVEASVRGQTARFELPASATDVWLVSSTSVPFHIDDSDDRRSLGLYLAGLSLDDGWNRPREVALDDSRLCLGFHAAEGQGESLRRWTSGQARLPAELWADQDGPMVLRVEVGEATLYRWVAPAAAIERPALFAAAA